MFFKNRKLKTCNFCGVQTSNSIVYSRNEKNEIVPCCCKDCAERVKKRSIELLENRISWIKAFKISEGEVER
jgi:hypothetical protein